jgi:hypothetical protein
MKFIFIERNTMNLKLSTIKIILISLFLLCNNLFSKGGGSRGIYSSFSHKKINNFTYDIELLPGQQFKGYWYFWSDGDTDIANFTPVPSVNWVSMSPRNFTSTSCSNIIPVAFMFRAPSTPGNYQMSFVDLNDNWEPVDINLSVTKNPVFATVSSVNSLVHESVQKSETTVLDNSGLGCLDTYLPSSTATVSFSTSDNVNWLKFNPQNFTLSESDPSVEVKKTFFSDDAGKF